VLGFLRGSSASVRCVLLLVFVCLRSSSLSRWFWAGGSWGWGWPGLVRGAGRAFGECGLFGWPAALVFFVGALGCVSLVVLGSGGRGLVGGAVGLFWGWGVGELVGGCFHCLGGCCGGGGGLGGGVGRRVVLCGLCVGAV